MVPLYGCFESPGKVDPGRAGLPSAVLSPHHVPFAYSSTTVAMTVGSLGAEKPTVTPYCTTFVLPSG